MDSNTKIGKETVKFSSNDLSFRMDTSRWIHLHCSKCSQYQVQNIVWAKRHVTSTIHIYNLFLLQNI